METAPPYKYDAFISYCHSDQKFARWLHHALENYRLPRHFGDSRRRPFKSVFRDTEELGAAPDLGVRIQGALRTSRCLIVICSHEAAASRWVDQEIEFFQAQDRDDSIFCIISDGVPDVVFPPALSRSSYEPLAADARPESGGRSEALLRLIAGMLDIDFDQLRRREQSRRYRRILGFGLASLSGMLITTGLASFALIQQSRAEQEARTASDVTQFVIELFDATNPLRSPTAGDLKARDLLDEGARRIERELANEPETRARLLHTIGVGYESLGLFEPAQQSLEEALDIRQSVFGSAHPDVAATQSELGLVLIRRGEYAKAEALLLSALELQRSLLSTADPQITRTLQTMSNLYTSTGRSDEAHRMLVDALDLLNEAQIADHSAIATARLSQAGLLLADGHYDAARERYIDLAEYADAQLWSGHPVAIASLIKIARIDRLLGHRERALDVLDTAHDRMQSHLGTDHPWAAEILSNRADLLRQEGRLKQAELEYFRAIEISIQANGPDHPVTARYHTGLGQVYHGMYEYEPAIAQHDKALSILDAFGPAQPQFANALRRKGSLLRDMNRLGEARVILERGLEVYKTTLGSSHGDTAWTEYDLAWTLYLSGDYEAAMRRYQRVLPVMMEAYGVESPDVAWCLGDMGAIALALGQEADALEYLNEAIKIVTKALGERHHNLAVPIGRLGSLYLSQGKTKDAIDRFELALELKMSSYGNDGPAIIPELQNLAVGYSAQGDIQESSRLLQRARDLATGTFGQESDLVNEIEEQLSEIGPTPRHN